MRNMTRRSRFSLYKTHPSPQFVAVSSVVALLVRSQFIPCDGRVVVYIFVPFLVDNFLTLSK